MDLPPPTPDRTSEHLRILSIFHYVFAGFALLGLLFVFGHHYLMTRMMSPGMWEGQANPPPEGLLALFVWVYALLGVFCVLGAVLNFLAARGLAQRRHWTLCAVVAGLNCLQMPLGTILGVFTLVVLTRDGVRAGFR